MRQHFLHVSRTVEAPQRAVWELIADVRTWSEWGPFDMAELETPGAPDAGGVGAVRRFRTGTRTTRERVTAVEAPRTLTYELLSGVPVRGYRATVRLMTTSGGTVVAWSSRFRPWFPGTGDAIRLQLQGFIEGMLDGLARHLETDVDPRRSRSTRLVPPLVVEQDEGARAPGRIPAVPALRLP